MRPPAPSAIARRAARSAAFVGWFVRMMLEALIACAPLMSARKARRRAAGLEFWLKRLVLFTLLARAPHHAHACSSPQPQQRFAPPPGARLRAAPRVSSIRRLLRGLLPPRRARDPAAVLQRLRDALADMDALVARLARRLRKREIRNRLLPAAPAPLTFAAAAPPALHVFADSS